jgi:hypothetical protein
MSQSQDAMPGSQQQVVQCPLCLQPARVLYQSEICQWGDNADNSTKGWQCGCEKCDHLFFVSRKQMALNSVKGDTIT